MILGAIEISSRSTRLSVADVTETDSVSYLDRSHSVRAELENLERLTALLMAEAEAARDLGVERLEVIAETGLRGTRLIRQLGRVCESIGAVGVRIPSERDRIAAEFLAAHVPTGDRSEIPVGVAVIAPGAIGIGVGQPGGPPVWIGSRPVGSSTISQKARFSNPPRPNQIEAAISGASRRLASLTPPTIERLLVSSDFAPVIRRLCGDSMEHEDARRGLGAILGQTSDDLAAWFGIEPTISRLLPGTMVGYAALADVFGVPAEPVTCDSVAGRFWLEQGQGDLTAERFA